MTDKMQKVKETIRSWMKCGGYPREFLNLFSHWTLFNLFYNEFSEESEEVFGVLDFGKKHESLFPNIEETAFSLVQTECVGEGRGDNPPNEWVKTASLQLRQALHMDTKRICASCRSRKRQECQKVQTKSYKFGKLEATLRILYQIRCNLFHGDKTEHTNGEQAERNWFLVRVADEILKSILWSVACSA